MGLLSLLQSGAIQAIGAGFVPYIPPPSILEEGDPANTAAFRNAPGLKYLDNPPN